MKITDRLDRIDELLDHVVEQEEKYQAFLDASPWGILVVDKTFHIVFVNKTLERMSGYSQHDLVGQHVRVLMPEQDHLVHDKHEKDYVQNPIVREGNHGLRPRLLHREGYIIDVEISLAPTKVHGRTYFFASIRYMESLFNSVGNK